MRKIDLTGQKFGMLTVIGPAEKKNRRYTCWICQCQCGRQTIVDGSHLKNGHTKSCGCYRRQAPKKAAKDLTGKQFGRLTVLGPAGDGIRGNWKCRCDCGNIVIRSKENLCSGSTRSCGCLQKEARKQDIKKSIHFVDGTCVERIASRKEAANNTSGHRGVYKRDENSWRACIGFQGKLYHLGSYKEYEQAVKAREEAERNLYDRFLEAYYGKNQQDGLEEKDKKRAT